MIQDFKKYDLYGKQTFVKAVVKPPFRIGAEMMDEACFYYVVAGCTAVITPAEKMMLNSDDGLVMQCGNYFNEFYVSPDTEYCEAIAVHFHPEVLKLVYDKDFPDFLSNVGAMKKLRYDKIRADKILRNYIENLRFYFDNPDLVSEELLKLKLKEIILLLAKTDSVESLRRLFGGLFDRAELDFREIIEANLYNNFSLQELAMLCNLSLSSFKREFVKNYDSSPAKYIKYKKLEKAAKLLRNTTARVSDIAFDCGFSDLPHFSKSFQKKYKSSPTEFRKEIS